MYRLPTDSTGCQLMPTVQFHGRQQLAGWQPVASVGNRWNELAPGGINWQPVKSVQKLGKLFKIQVKPHRTGGGCATVCQSAYYILVIINTRRVDWANWQDLKNTRHTRFLFSQDCSTVNI
jgi:hypothetical protein